MKKLMSVLLAAVLTVSISIPAFAEYPEADTEPDVMDTVDLTESAEPDERETAASEPAQPESDSITDSTRIGISGSIRTLIFGTVLVGFGAGAILLANKKARGKKNT